MDHTILVVDDESASLRALRRALQPQFQVLTAAGGTEALAVLEARAVSVVITDHRMPGMSGVELLAACRARHPDVVRIVLTGYADVDALGGAINAGEVFQYVTKPWASQALLMVVRRAVERFEAGRERERLIRELEAAGARARREADHRARLLATTLHELGSPVHVLSNAIEMLAAEPAARASQWFPMVERGARWLARSLAQIQMAAHLRERRVELGSHQVDVGASVAAVLAALQAAVGDRSLVFSLSAEPGVRVRGDEHWLRQLWIGVLSNAVRFTPDGGAVRVSVERRAAEAEVIAADTGVGMTEEQLAVAFEPFSAAGGDLLLHSSGRFRFGSRGLGLGLSIARGIVEAHGGTIAVASRPGRGTRVTIRLPVDSREWDGAAAPGDPPAVVHEGGEESAGAGGLKFG